MLERVSHRFSLLYMQFRCFFFLGGRPNQWNPEILVQTIGQEGSRADIIFFASWVLRVCENLRGQSLYYASCANLGRPLKRTRRVLLVCKTYVILAYMQNQTM